jgi:hypothetical protein
MKRVLVVVGILLVLIISTLFYVNKSRGERIRNIVNVKFDTITRIEFMNGRTGEKTSIEDIDKIREFMNYIDSYVVKETKQVQGEPGYNFMADFYYNKDKAFRIIFEDPLSINDKGFDIIRKSLDKEKFEKFIRSMSK